MAVYDFDRIFGAPTPLPFSSSWNLDSSLYDGSLEGGKMWKPVSKFRALKYEP